MFGGILVLVVTMCVQSFWGGDSRGGKGSWRGSEQSQPSSHLSGQYGLPQGRGAGRGSDTSERQFLGLQDSIDRAVGRALERLAGAVLGPHMNTLTKYQIKNIDMLYKSHASTHTHTPRSLLRGHT